MAGNLEVDAGFSASSMAHLILEFHHLSPFATPQYTLPIVEDGQSYYYRGGGYGDVVFPVEPQDSKVVAQFLGTTPTQNASGRALPPRSSFTVAVENGSGTYDGGSQTAKALEALGYDVTSVTDTEASRVDDRDRRALRQPATAGRRPSTPVRSVGAVGPRLRPGDDRERLPRKWHRLERDDEHDRCRVHALVLETARTSCS